MSEGLKNLTIMYDHIGVGIRCIYKDGYYHIFRDGDTEVQKFKSDSSAFKHIIYLMSIDCGLGGVIPR